MRTIHVALAFALVACGKPAEVQRPAPQCGGARGSGVAMAPRGEGLMSRAGSPSQTALAGRPTGLRPVHTFSIVARDPRTGDLGVAVQSHWFAVGTTVPWAEPGVGAIATQSFVEPSYGPRGLELLRGGTPAAEALARLVAEDPGRDVRQVAFVDASGRAAAHTGRACIEHADQHVGDGYSAQANMMQTDQVVPAMARAYESTQGDLAARLYAALQAGQAAGGDLRGCQSAALRVVAGTRSDHPWADTRFDLRVDDSADPIAELGRLLGLARAYDEMNRGDVSVEKGDMAGALRHYGAAADMTGGATEMLFWQAVALAAHGDLERALPLFRRVYAADRRWIELTRRLHKPGIIPDTPEGHALVDRIVREASPR